MNVLNLALGFDPAASVNTLRATARRIRREKEMRRSQMGQLSDGAIVGISPSSAPLEKR